MKERAAGQLVQEAASQGVPGTGGLASVWKSQASVSSIQQIGISAEHLLSMPAWGGVGELYK